MLQTKLTIFDITNQRCNRLTWNSCWVLRNIYGLISQSGIWLSFTVAALLKTSGPPLICSTAFCSASNWCLMLLLSRNAMGRCHQHIWGVASSVRLVDKKRKCLPPPPRATSTVQKPLATEPMETDTQVISTAGKWPCHPTLYHIIVGKFWEFWVISDKNRYRSPFVNLCSDRLDLSYMLYQLMSILSHLVLYLLRPSLIKS